MIKIPFSFLPLTTLYKVSSHFLGLAQRLERKYPNLSVYLTQAEARIGSLEYLSMCITATFLFATIFFFLSLILLFFKIPFFFVLVLTFIFTFFVFAQQLAYPKLIANRRVRQVERNLLPALEDILIQLNSGIPLFNILANVAEGDYGAVSDEFRQAVREINAGRSQIDALEDIALNNPSVLFRRAIWQIVNGMKEGADIATLIKDVMQAVTDEQLTQIQKYGGQLSPLALFYMLIAIIAPSLGVTFIIILSSFISIEENVTKSIFYGLIILTFLFQIMFLGMIKTRRPSLL